MPLPVDERLLERNLRALARTSPLVAKAVAAAPARPDIVFETTDDGVPTGAITIDGKRRSLASARHPLREADRLAEQADPSQAAIFAVLGFGLGYHVDAMVHRLGGKGLVLCFEPDLSLLRAVLEHIDCTACFESDRLIIIHDVASSDTISARLKGLEGVLALGVRFIAHPPSTARLGEQADRFAKRLVEVIAAAKTSIVTVLMQTEKTIENTLGNARAYAAHAGVNDLENAIRGTPAIVVSAGPSLAESIPTLARPETRERACIIAAQTVLRPLLEHGIRPHFVTALDHHDISRRFYEGLTADMVEGITLVAEPKANPAIIQAWPGALRFVGDEILDRVLASSEHAPMRGGTTVAHLSYYLARYLGCDPVVLVGQDLAYTDGLYYGPNAAIHNVWSAELGEFRTLEMMEAERIGRARRMLRRTEDNDGRPLLTDEQLHTYRMQFERDFAEDERSGLTIIDAGRGAAKAHTTPMTLPDAMDQYGKLVALPATPSPQDRSERVDARLRETAEQARRMATLTRTAEQMVRGLDAYGDAKTMNEQVEAIHAVRDEAEALDPAYWLTQFLNQTGGLRRAKRDRAIAIASDEATDRDIQAQRIERDAENLQWLAQAADRLAELLDGTAQQDQPGTPHRVRPEASRKLPAIVWHDPARGGLNHDRDLAATIVDGLSAPQITLRTLARCKRVSEIVLVTTDTHAAKHLADASASGPPVRIWSAGTDTSERRAAIGAARARTPSSFRGGLASLTVFDEAFDPSATLAIMDEIGAPAVLVLGADWALLDAQLTDEVAERLLADPEARHIAFAQAPAGLAPCALARPAVSEIANNPSAGPIATIGGLLAYAPHAARPDPIARDICVTVDPPLRDLGRRLIPDSVDRRATLLPALREVTQGRDVASRLPQLLGEALQRPTHLRAMLAEGEDPDLRERVLAFARGAADSAITLDCSDCGYTPFADDLAIALRKQGAGCVHVRTPLAWGQEEIDRLLASPADIISVDVTDPTFPPPLEAFPEMVGAGLRRPWIVPRLRRNEAMLDTLLEQYDAALTRFGAATIEPDVDDQAGRLVALPLPVAAKRRLDRENRQTNMAATRETLV